MSNPTLTYATQLPIQSAPSASDFDDFDDFEPDFSEEDNVNGDDESPSDENYEDDDVDEVVEKQLTENDIPERYRDAWRKMIASRGAPEQPHQVIQKDLPESPFPNPFIEQPVETVNPYLQPAYHRVDAPAAVQPAVPFVNPSLTPAPVAEVVQPVQVQPTVHPQVVQATVQEVQPVQPVVQPQPEIYAATSTPLAPAQPAVQAWPPSYASLHADQSGFVAFPRWFHESPFWKGLRGEHRAVLSELYFRMQRTEYFQPGTGMTLSRGQFALTLEQLADDSGTTIQQVRTAIDKAVTANIVKKDITTVKNARSTWAMCVFSWVEFETYDNTKNLTNITPNITTNITVNTPNTRANTRLKTRDTDKNTNNAPPSVSAAPAGPNVVSSEAGGVFPNAQLSTKDSQTENANTDMNNTGSSFINAKSIDQSRVKSNNLIRDRKGKLKSKGEEISDELKVRICSDWTTLGRYLCWGPDAIGIERSACDSLPRTSTYWNDFADDAGCL